MIVTQDIARIAQALLKDTTGSLVEATWQSLTPLQLTPGQMVRGEVMANLANSRYLVRIANELLRMELPLNLQPGQAVELTYVTDEPRLLFALSKSGNSATPVQISDTGRWLNTLAQGAGDVPAANPLPRPSLLISVPPRNPALLAEGLRNALSRSGIFYESHLAQWVRGERPITDLLREPQGKLSPLAGRLPATGDPLTPQGTQTAPPPRAPSPAPTHPVVTADTPPMEKAGAPASSRTTVAEGTPPGQGNAPPATNESSPQGRTPPAAGAATDTQKGGRIDDSPETLPPGTTSTSPKNQPAGPARPGEPSAPPPSQPRQAGPALSPPLPPAGEPPPPASSQTTPAPEAAPQPKPNGAGTVGHPPLPTSEKAPAPQSRDAVVPGPTGREHPPAPAPGTRPAAESHPPPPLRDGAPIASNARAATPPPLAGTPEGGGRTAIPGEAMPADRGGAGRPTAPAPPAGVEPQTIPLIKEQLTTLSTGVFAWFGQAWPGQEMEWRVEEREAEGGKGERSWLTEVAVVLPCLGAVRATLRSGREGIIVNLGAEDGRTAEILSARQEGLEERFGAAGLRLGGFTVRDGT